MGMNSERDGGEERGVERRREGQVDLRKYGQTIRHPWKTRTFQV